MKKGLWMQVLPLLLLVTLFACQQGGRPSQEGQARPGQEEAPVYGQEAPRVIPGSYIVVLREERGKEVEELLEALERADLSALGLNPSEARVQFVYKEALKGFAARLTPAALARLRRDPRVAYVQLDRALEYQAVQPNPPGAWTGSTNGTSPWTTDTPTPPPAEGLTSTSLTQASA
jgi:hypothetical protein